MVLIGFSGILSLTQSVGIVVTMVLTLYFSKRQIQALSSDQETRVLNDLDEKFHSMAMLAMASTRLCQQKRNGVFLLSSVDVRPRLCDATEKVGIKLPIILVKRTDKARGDIPCSKFIRRAVEQYIRTRAPKS